MQRRKEKRKLGKYIAQRAVALPEGCFAAARLELWGGLPVCPIGLLKGSCDPFGVMQRRKEKRKLGKHIAQRAVVLPEGCFAAARLELWGGLPVCPIG
ncbi:hypothetical protein CDL15_Pgr016564 [Punica granatum]|uniref:Uncharacterized protein n=1 Tax=Punica granatum TaxID=22663 RepID=A0A218WLM7_PUNGR|nr:hypothetical protein CDL15_Pgr016564 [Punica granatum]